MIYRGEKLVLWDYEREEIYGSYEKETGESLSEDRATSIRTISLSHNDINGSRVAVTYTDGDLVKHDMDEGKSYLDEMDEGLSMILASGDESGRVTVWSVSRRNARSQPGWTVSPEPLVATRSQRIRCPPLRAR